MSCSKPTRVDRKKGGLHSAMCGNSRPPGPIVCCLLTVAVGQPSPQQRGGVVNWSQRGREARRKRDEKKSKWKKNHHKHQDRPAGKGKQNRKPRVCSCVALWPLCHGRRKPEFPSTERRIVSERVISSHPAIPPPCTSSILSSHIITAAQLLVLH